MLEITIDLLPHGFENKRKRLHIGYIINDGTGTYDKGNYKAYFCRKGSSNRYTGKKSIVNGFSRTRKNAWYLLYLALKGIYDK